MHTDEEIAGALRLKAAIAGGRLLLAGWRLQYALKFNPSWHLQPRVPAGNSDGGRWTDGRGTSGDDGGIVHIAERKPLQKYQVDLVEEEVAGGHAIKDHVGRSPDSLLAKTRQKIPISPFASLGFYRQGSFPSLAAANRLVNAALSRNRATVDEVANGTLRKAFLTATFSSQTGIESFRSSSRSQPHVRDTFGVGVYIVHDPNSGKGFRVVTAYPRND